MSYDDVATALRDHGISFDPASLKADFDAQGPEAVEWARGLIGPDSLLTRDEVELYTALAKSGRAEKLVAGATSAGAELVPLSGGDEELRAAVEELNRSTAAISKQTEALRRQQDALARLVKLETQGAGSRAAMEGRRAQTLAIERRRLTEEVETLSQKTGFQVADLEQNTVGTGGGSGGGLAEAVGGLLRSDDTLLASLQKLGWELETEDPEEKDGVVKLREVCARLIKYTVETLRTRLDRIYLETLRSSSNGGRGQQSSSDGGDDVAGMQAELDELYTEILPVAQMSVEQQYLEPALQSLTGRSAVNLSRSVEALDYIDACLNYLLANITALTARVEDHRAHESAADALLTQAKAELAHKINTNPPTNKPRNRAPTIGASPLRRRKSSGAGGGSGLGSSTSPSRSRGPGPGPTRRRSSGAGAGASGGADDPPLEHLLRSLALSLPSAEDDTNTRTTSPDDAATLLLEAALADRTAKTADVARNAQASFEDVAAAQMGDSLRAVGVVRESVLAETTSAPRGEGQIAFVDPGIDASIGMLALEVSRVRSRLEEVEGELLGRAGGGAGGGGAGKSVKREEFVRRWGAAR